jgi:S1-C subfamily serine protease
MQVLRCWVHMARKLSALVLAPAPALVLAVGVLGFAVFRGMRTKAHEPATMATTMAATVVVYAPGCGPVNRTGLGVLVSPSLVLTDAHVVAGANPLSISPASSAKPSQTSLTKTPAELVYLDPRADLALLRIEPLSGQIELPVRANADPRNSSVPRGSVAVMVALRDGRAIAQRIQIVRPVQLDTKDIYGKRKVKRLGYEIRTSVHAGVHPGDSGSPVVVNGELVGVVWSRSQERTDRAWATDTGPIEKLLRTEIRFGSSARDAKMAVCP